MNLLKMQSLAVMMTAAMFISSCGTVYKALPCPPEENFDFHNVDKPTQVELAKVHGYILKLRAACK